MSSKRSLSAITESKALDSAFDSRVIRSDFPILQKLIDGKPLVYLDNAATTQKPQTVIDALTHYYTTENANIHRGIHSLAAKATVAYEKARSQVRQFLNAKSSKEIIFVRSATEAINLVAQTFGRERIVEGDEILISTMEHHSNIVPWQLLTEQTGSHLKVIPIDDNGDLVIQDFEKLLSTKTKLVALTHVSNALGTINPVREIIEEAHRHHIPVLLDGAQATLHLPIDVQELDCDFYAISGHKMLGPTGIGVLFGKQSLLEAMPPYQGGGEMILSVNFDKTIYNELPLKFEAGTPNIAGAIGLGAATEYLSHIGMDRIASYEGELLDYATHKLSLVPGIRLIGTAREKSGILSFTLEGTHPHDVGTILNEEGIAVRTGHHCAQPVIDRFGVPATVRASLALYNTKEDIDALVRGMEKVREIFR